MRNLDRFQPPQPNEEPHYECDNCGAIQHYADLLYDNYTDKHFCDEVCFGDWAGNNPEVIEEFYFSRNIE